MSTLRIRTDQLIRAVNGGLNTMDSKWDPLYIESLMPSLREKAMVIHYFGDRFRAATRRIEYAWIQPTTVQVDTGLDSDLDYITFTMPKVASIGNMVDGFVYVGQKNSSVSFSKAKNREDIANMKARNMFDGSVIAYIWEGGKLEVYGNKMLTEVNVRGVFADPTEVSGYNIEVDDYPINEDLLLIMAEVFKIDQGINIQRIGDKTLDGVESAKQQ